MPNSSRSVAARRPLRRIAAALGVLALLGLAATAGAQSSSPAIHSAANSDKAHYLPLATKGIANARSHWWNGKKRWYNDRLNDGDPYPLATIWSIVPLFEAVDGVAIANPTSKNKKAVKSFATFAEKYWNKNVPSHGAYGPYPGDRNGSEEIWFDDNSWWGLGFVDAYRATKNTRWLGDAKRAMKFTDSKGWVGGGAGGGMWWTTKHHQHSLEALGAATALAAELYEFTGESSFRKIARKYLAWANKYAFNAGHSGLYENSTQPVMTYVEGSLIGAHLSLCRKGDQGACAKAGELGQAAFEWWHGQDPNFAPQFDTILFRYMIQLASHDKNPTWYDWARRSARDAEKHARDKNGLFLKFWDGTPAKSHGDGAGQFRYGMIQTHAAPVALFAWLAAVPAPG